MKIIITKITNKLIRFPFPIFSTMNYIDSQTLTRDSDEVSCVAVINENTIVSGSADNLLRIWDIKSGKVIQTLTGHSSEVFCVFMINENIIVSCSADFLLKIWDVTSGKEIKSLTGHSNIV